MSQENDNAVSFGVGILAGILAGVAAGVLFAPKPGEETRKELKEVADRLTNNVTPEVTKAKDVGLEMLEKFKFSVEKQLNKLQEAIKASKMASAKEREAAESGYDY